MYANGGTATDTLVYAAGSEATDSTEWQEISPQVFSVTVISHEEPAKQEQDEPDTGERPVYCERPNRRLATVNRAGRTSRPRKAASTWG
jgi:hypothetical protein